MAGDRHKEIVRHLSEDDLDRLLDETDNDNISKRLTFVKRLYKGATLEDTADDGGKSSATATRWARRWNDGGFGLLTPNFGGGRPPKLDDNEQDEFVEFFRDGQPWKSREIRHLLMDEFGVEYHPDYLGTFLRDLGLSYAKPQPKRPSQPENPDDILEERVDDALDEDEQPHNKRAGDDEEGWIVEEDVCTDGGTVIGFFDASHPQPYDNSRRVWYVDDPHVERPLVKTEDSAVGFYALNGESVVRFTEDETKERIYEILEVVREQNPGTRIPLVLDKHGSHMDLDVAGEDGKSVRLGIVRSGDKHSERLFHSRIEPSGSM